MATIKYRPDDLSITFTRSRDDPTKVRAAYSTQAWLDAPGVKRAAVEELIYGDRTITFATFKALTGQQMLDQVEADIVSKIPAKFGTGHTIEEDNS